MDLLAGYGSGSDSDDAGAPGPAPAAVAASAKVVAHQEGSAAPELGGKPGVRKVSMKSLTSLLPPPKAAAASVPQGPEEEEEDPLWKRLKSQKPSGLSLFALLPKPVHDDSSRARKVESAVAGATAAGTEEEEAAPPVLANVNKRAAQAAPVPAATTAAPARGAAGQTTVTAAAAAGPASGVDSGSALKKVRIDVTVPVAPTSFAAPAWTAPRAAATASAAPYTAPKPAHAAAQYAVGPSYGAPITPATYDASAAAAYRVGHGQGYSGGGGAAPDAPAAAVATGTGAGPGPAGLDRHMRKALASGAFVAMESVSAAELSGEWDARSVDVTPRQKIEVKGSFWNAAAGEVVTTTKPNKLQSSKHQINSLAFQAKQMEADLHNRKSMGTKTKAQTYGRYGW